MLRAGSCDYCDSYTLVKGTITVENTAAATIDAINANRKVIYLKTVYHLLTA